MGGVHAEGECVSVGAAECPCVFVCPWYSHFSATLRHSTSKPAGTPQGTGPESSDQLRSGFLLGAPWASLSSRRLEGMLRQEGILLRGPWGTAGNKRARERFLVRTTSAGQKRPTVFI